VELKISELEKSLLSHPEIKKGCIVDTNVIFAASYPLDTYNEWGEEVFRVLHKLNIPVYTNLNIRSEFIDLSRRVLIPEGLIDFYEVLSGTLEDEIEARLKSLKTRKRKANDEGRTFKLSDSEIKQYAELLNSAPSLEGISGWAVFCRDYFAPYIVNVWESVVQQMKINFLGTREIESKEFFERHPTWDNMMRIVATTGIGSADAMIINLFQESKIPTLVTADNAIKVTVLNNYFGGKFILSP
jgi:predicted nucleic acid-binding protein